jgi:hypothetical protein
MPPFDAAGGEPLGKAEVVRTVRVAALQIDDLAFTRHDGAWPGIARFGGEHVHDVVVV